MSKDQGEVVRLSNRDWMRITGVLVLHTVLVCGFLFGLYNKLDQRTTRVEANQMILLQHSGLLRGDR